MITNARTTDVIIIPATTPYSIFYGAIWFLIIFTVLSLTEHFGDLQVEFDNGIKGLPLGTQYPVQSLNAISNSNPKKQLEQSFGP